MPKLIVLACVIVEYICVHIITIPNIFDFNNSIRIISYNQSDIIIIINTLVMIFII